MDVSAKRPACTERCHPSLSDDRVDPFRRSPFQHEALGLFGLARRLGRLERAASELARAPTPELRAAAATELLHVAGPRNLEQTRIALEALLEAQRDLGKTAQALRTEADLAFIDGRFSDARAALAALEAHISAGDVAAAAELAGLYARAVDLEVNALAREGAIDAALGLVEARFDHLAATGGPPERLRQLRQLGAELATRKLSAAAHQLDAQLHRPSLTRTSNVAASRPAVAQTLEDRARANASPQIEPELEAMQRARAEVAAWTRRTIAGDASPQSSLQKELALADRLERAGDIDGARAVLAAAARATEDAPHRGLAVANRRLGLELAFGPGPALEEALESIRRLQPRVPKGERFLHGQALFLETEAQLALGSIDRTKASRRLLDQGRQLTSSDDARAVSLAERLLLKGALLAEPDVAGETARQLWSSEDTEPEIAAAAGLLLAGVALERGDPEGAARQVLAVQARLPDTKAVKGLGRDPRFGHLVDDSGRLRPAAGDLGAAFRAALDESGRGPALRSLVLAGVGFSLGGPLGAAAGLALDRALGIAEGFDHVSGAYATGLTRAAPDQTVINLFMLSAEMLTLGSVAGAAIGGRVAARRLAARGLRTSGLSVSSAGARVPLAGAGYVGEALGGTFAGAVAEAVRTGEPLRWRPEEAALWVAGRIVAGRLSQAQWGSRARETLRQTFAREATLAGQTAAVDITLRAAFELAGADAALPDDLLEHADPQAKALLLLGLLGRGLAPLERAARRADARSTRLASEAIDRRPPGGPLSGPQLAFATAPVPGGRARRAKPMSADALGRGSLLGEASLRNLDGDLADPQVRYANEAHLDRRVGSTEGLSAHDLVTLLDDLVAEGIHPNAARIFAERAARQVAASFPSLDDLAMAHARLAKVAGADITPLHAALLERYRGRIREIQAMPSQNKKVAAAEALGELAAAADLPVWDAYLVGGPKPPLETLSPEAQAALRKLQAGAKRVDVSSRAVAEEILTQFPEFAETSLPKSVANPMLRGTDYEHGLTYHWDTEQGPDGRVVDHPKQPGVKPEDDHGLTPHLQLERKPGTVRIHFPWPAP